MSLREPQDRQEQHDKGGRGKGKGKDKGKSKSKRKRKHDSKKDAGGEGKDKRPKKIGEMKNGNYQRYYEYRSKPGDQWNDRRFSALRAEWFRGKRCLDIGCNVGCLTIEIGRRFACRSIRGVDVDPKLIGDARRLLTQRYRQAVLGGIEEEQSPSAGTSACRSVEKKEEQSVEFPDNVSFKTQDFAKVQHSKGSIYDTVCCFSVTKWVHMNHGDAGLLKLFRDIHTLLSEGGIFILEPQPWKSYKKKYWGVSEEMTRIYQSIQIKPTDFCQVLEEIGFSRIESIQPPDDVTAGFDRPIYMYSK